jgi:hypothetical protein
MAVSNAALESRQNEQALLAKVQAARHELAIRSLCALLEHRLKKLDMRLRTCPVEEFVAIQAQAQQLERLISELAQP